MKKEKTISKMKVQKYMEKNGSVSVNGKKTKEMKT